MWSSTKSHYSSVTPRFQSVNFVVYCFLQLLHGKSTGLSDVLDWETAPVELAERYYG